MNVDKTPMAEALKRIAELTRPEQGEEQEIGLREWELDSLFETVRAELPHLSLADDEILCLSCFYAGRSASARMMREHDVERELALREIDGITARLLLVSLQEKNVLREMQPDDDDDDAPACDESAADVKGRAARKRRRAAGGGPRLSVSLDLAARLLVPHGDIPRFKTVREHLVAWVDAIGGAYAHRKEHSGRRGRFDEDSGSVARNLQSVPLPQDLRRRIRALEAFDVVAPGRFPLQRLVARMRLDNQERDQLLCALWFSLRNEGCEIRDLQIVADFDPFDTARRRGLFSPVAPLFFSGILVPDDDVREPFGGRTDVVVNPGIREWLLTGEGAAFDALCESDVLDPSTVYRSNKEYVMDWVRLFHAWRMMLRMKRGPRGLSDSSRLFQSAAGADAQTSAGLREIEQAIVARAARSGIEFPLEGIVGRHGLGEVERGILLVLLERSLSNQDSEVRDVVEWLCPDPFDGEDALRHFRPDAPLLAHNLVEISPWRSLLRSDIRIAPETRDEILGVKAGAKREGIAHLLGSKAVLSVERVRHTLDDLVVPAHIRGVLDAAIVRFESRADELLASWGVGAPADHLPGAGAKDAAKGPRGAVRLLFSGTPGTGKTLAAGALAGTMGRELLVTDVSKVVSVWVGESQKNVSAIFDEYERVAARSGSAPVLLLNECDQFLQRRGGGDGHSVDRMYHEMQNIFLERLERFRGILIATTNLVGSLDEAFSRRFDYKLVFPEPDAATRLLIWRKHVGTRMPLADDVDLQHLADAYVFSGGQIDVVVRNAALSAAVRGDVVRMSDLVAACDGEASGTFEAGSAAHRSVGFRTVC